MPLSGLAQQDAPTDFYRFRMPGKNWSVNIPSWAFTESSEQLHGEARVFSGGRLPDKKLKVRPLILEIRMEPSNGPADAQALSDFRKNKLRKQEMVVPESVKQTVYNNIPVIHYATQASLALSPQMKMDLPRAKIFEAYYIKDDVWIIVQMRFLDFDKKEDEKLVFAFLDSLQIQDIPK